MAIKVKDSIVNIKTDKQSMVVIGNRTYKGKTVSVNGNIVTVDGVIVDDLSKPKFNWLKGLKKFFINLQKKWQ